MNRYQIILKEGNVNWIIDVVEDIQEAKSFIKVLIEQRDIGDDWDVEIEKEE